MAEYTISYSSGWPDWYVSDFYKFFHKKIVEEKKINVDYIEIKDLNKEYNIEEQISSDSVFSHYSLIIRKNSNKKLFVHSWYDHAFATLEWCIRNNIEVSVFSGVSNITKNFIKKHNNVQPSIYCLEYWSDHKLIEQYKNSQKRHLNAYFAGLPHGIRVHAIETLNKNPFFDIHDKTKLYIAKNEYYKKIAESFFGLSFNGAANICYRDLELFGLGTLNLRQPLDCVTYNPLVENVHYYNFLNESFIQKIISYHAFNSVTEQEINKLIQEKVEEIKDFIHTQKYRDMVLESQNWFKENCLPDKQFEILFSFLKDFSIFE